jgi:glucose/arabinose dehydrogenase
MDFNNMRLRVIGGDGRVQTVIGNGFHAIATTGIDARETSLENPIDFGWLPDGRIVFVSYHDPRVLVLDDDGTLSSIAGTGDTGRHGNEGDGGPAAEAMFMQLDGIAVTVDGAVYVSDSIANRVRRIQDGVIMTVAGDGRPAWTGDGGPGTAASLNWPTALALDSDGNLFIADAQNHVIRRLGLDGIITTVAGTGLAGDDGDGGPATEAQLHEPTGIEVGADGALYIGDRRNFRVRRVSPDGRIDTLGGTGEEGLAGDGGPALQAQFGYIARVALDGHDVLVADQSNSCVRRILAAR